MASLAKAAAMLPASAGGVCCPPACQCAVRSVQACRAKTPAQEACVCFEKELMVSQPAADVSERRPVFHLAPAGGWINDPNGPLLHNGTYHLFYQHVPASPTWQWGLVWGHAKSKDLIHWEHLPVALEPTPNSLDQHGCFSGCATVDVDGRPALLYTGVIRKTLQEIEADPGTSHQHEAQLIAVATDLDDPDLRHWQKLPGSFLPHPPADMNLTGWRDPFVLEKPSASSPWWYVMIGAGVRNKCGTALVYRSKDLTEGWQYVGPLCESSGTHMWECPIMARLTNTAPTGTATARQGKQLQRHMLSVSPDYCVNMIQYYLGHYAEGTFDMDSACGPHKMDLGDVMYAPNVLTDEQGRTVLWAWLQEKEHHRPPGTYTSSCCLCVPRALYLSPDGSTLLQEPLPELRELRQQGAWHVGAAAAAGGRNGTNTTGVQLAPGEPLQLGAGVAGFSSSSVDLELQVAKGGGDSFALVLHPFDGAEGAAGAAITYCWGSRELQVVYSTELGVLERMAATPLAPRTHYKLPGPDPMQLAAAEAAAAEPGVPLRCGGPLRDGQDASSDVLSLRILLDGSCLEVFTSTGEALTTRVYRGDEPSLRADAPHASFPQAGSSTGAAPPRCSSPAEAAMAAAAAAGAVGWEQLFRGAGSNGSGATALAGGQLELVSFGMGPATLLSGSAWQMGSIWQQQQVQQEAAAAAAAEVLQGLVVAEVAAAAAAAAAVAPVVLPVGELSLDVGVAAAAASAELAGGAAELLPLSPTAASPVQVQVGAA